MSDVFINDIFWTHQGEGVHAGRRALFIRLPKCNLQCSWCDTSFNEFYKIALDKIKEIALSEKSRFAVITGGEPLMNRAAKPIVAMLKENGFYVACETNGTFPANANYDFITCSPKRDAGYKVHPELFGEVSEFKYVVDEGFDWTVLDRHRQLDRAFLSLSPEFGRFKESIAEISNYIKEHPEWRISLQTHKWMGIP